MPFRIVSIAAAILCLTLASFLFVFPDFIYWIFGLDSHALGDFLAKRAAMLFLGFATLCYLSRNAEDCDLRRAISLSIAITMAGLALSGIYEYLRGYVGPGIWLAIITEAAFAAAYARFSLRPDQIN